MSKKEGLKFKPHFVRDQNPPLNSVDWEERTASITDMGGNTIFEQKGLQVPKDWSQTATNIVASKYFHGKLGTGKREYHVGKLVERVANTIHDWGMKGGYFSDTDNGQTFKHELQYLLVNQFAAFNSPVWFNLGIEEARGYGWYYNGLETVKMTDEGRPQCSACFINSVEDSLESILDLAKTEGMLFKWGSGTGSNLSNLREENGSLSSGGRASGPLSFMKGFDAFAGVIKSGGKCLAATQQVYTVSGPKTARELAGTRFVTLSFDPPSKRMKPKWATCWLSGQKKMVAIVTDKGRFEVSEDHPFRLPSGQAIRADELVAGMSLMAVTIDESAGHLRVTLKDGKKGREHLHRMVARDILGWDVENCVVYHGNNDALNNDPSNLEQLPNQSEHARLHNEQNVTRGKKNGMHRDGNFWKNAEEVAKYKQLQGESRAATSRMINKGQALINAGHDISTIDKYVVARKAQAPAGFVAYTRQNMLDKFEARFGGYDEFLQELSASNHRVREVVRLSVQDTYSVEVECPTADDKSPSSGHTYLLWSGTEKTGSGVVVFNTRRAAKMVILNSDHPDIEKFVWCKANEEKKAHALVAAGYDNALDGEAYGSIFFQNANNSVRVDDAFMQAVVDDEDYQLKSVLDGRAIKTVKARKLMNEIAEATWVCGDPGMQFDTTINKWHTCKNTARINASNPCCFIGGTCVDGSEGFVDIAELEKMSSAGIALPYAFGFDNETHLPAMRRIKKAWVAGYTCNLIEVKTSSGMVFRCTPEHGWLLRKVVGSQYVAAKNLKPGMSLRKIKRSHNSRDDRYYISHRQTKANHGGTSQARFMWEQAHGPIPSGFEVHHIDEDKTHDVLSNLELKLESVHLAEHSQGLANNNAIEISASALVEVWDAIYATPKKTHTSKAKVTPARWNEYVRNNGLVGVIPQAQSPSTGGRIQGLSWCEFSEKMDKARMMVNDTVVSVTPITLDREIPVYDIEVEGINNFGIRPDANCHESSIVVSNSEYMFLDDSACNLSSLNLMKFLKADGEFDVEGFRHAVRILITAMEIIVGGSSYPTAKIAENSYKYRPLGLGFANLGSLLMCSGMAYDSDEGRNYAGLISSIMSGQAYAQSALIAGVVGIPEGIEKNRVPFLKVVAMHREAQKKYWKMPNANQEMARASDDCWAAAETNGELYGYRNAQVSVIAPTGTIGFMMDCDTTGIEPELALVKFKRLVGGGTIKLVNTMVPNALAKLGYTPEQSRAIVAYVDDKGTIENAPGLRDEHLPVFDCSFKAQNGVRTIHYSGHIKMMAAVQPFTSGAISKTINMPENATVDEIMDAYVESWRLGLKAVAIYRDNSKKVQPLSSGKETEVKKIVVEHAEPKQARRKLPDERPAVTHKFTIGNHEGYLTVGLFDDGAPGEIFITMAKEGSTISGLMDCFATAVSYCLQYGVSLKFLVDKFGHVRFEPSGWTGNKDIPYAKSLPDYIFRWMALKFINTEKELREYVEAAKAVSQPGKEESHQDDSPPCHNCGGIMTRNGSCYKCGNCGETSGCS